MENKAESNIRNMRSSDIDDVVKVHLESFPNFFLTFLGNRFLKLLYGEILKDQGSVCLVYAPPGNCTQGFAVGVVNQVGLYKMLALKKWYAFAAASIGMALRHPAIITRLFRALTYSSKSSSAACPALLMSLAVDPKASGKGIGKLLVDEFLREMSKMGIDKVSLTTDRDNNERTNVFYEKLGFSIASQNQTPEGRWMNEYIIETKRIIK